MSDSRTGDSSLARPSSVPLAAALTLALTCWLAGRAGGQEPEGVGNGKDTVVAFHEPFQGIPVDAARWKFVGPAAEKCVLFEPAGLRITLPTGFAKVRGFTGLITAYPIKGDFEITANFEILQETQEENDAEFASSRLALTAHLATPLKDIVGVNRALAQHTGRFVAWHAWTEAPGKQKTDVKVENSEAKAGRLRIVRKDAHVFCYAAEGSNSGFKLLQEFPAVEGDVKEIRIAAQTGGPKASIDVRITDLRIHTGSVPSTPLAAPPVAQEEPLPSFRWKLWLGAAIIGLVIVLFLSVWFFSSQRERAGNKTSHDAGEGQQANAEADTSPVSFHCADCGKKLKVKAELAGKKVKCSQCGNAVVVPVRQAGEQAPNGKA